MNKKQLIVALMMGTYILLLFFITFVVLKIIPDIAETMPPTAKVPFSLQLFLYFAQIVRKLFLPVLTIGGLLIYILRTKKR